MITWCAITQFVMCRANGYNLKAPRPHRKGLLWTTTCDECKRRLHDCIEDTSVVHRNGQSFMRCRDCTGMGPMGMGEPAVG